MNTAIRMIYKGLWVLSIGGQIQAADMRELLVVNYITPAMTTYRLGVPGIKKFTGKDFSPVMTLHAGHLDSDTQALVAVPQDSASKVIIKDNTLRLRYNFNFNNGDNTYVYTQESEFTVAPDAVQTILTFSRKDKDQLRSRDGAVVATEVLATDAVPVSTTITYRRVIKERFPAPVAAVLFKAMNKFSDIG